MNDGKRTIWFNAEPYHMGAAALARWQETVLRKLTDKSDAAVVVSNKARPPKGSSMPAIDVIICKCPGNVLYLI